MLFRMFGTIPDTYPNPPCSKSWAIAQAFWSKSADFGPFGIHPKSSPTFSKVVGNPFASTLDAFQDVWNDSRNLPKSAMFKTMGYSPGFLVKIGQFRTLRNSSEILTNILESSWKSIWEHIGCFSVCLERSRNLPKSAMFKTMGYSPGFLVKIGQFRTLRNSSEILTNILESSWKSIWEHIGCFSVCLERSRNLPKSAMFKTMGYSPGFLVKIGQFRTLRNSSEIFTNILESSWKCICKHIGGDLGSLERIPNLTQIRHLQNRGL